MYDMVVAETRKIWYDHHLVAAETRNGVSNLYALLFQSYNIIIIEVFDRHTPSAL